MADRPGRAGPKYRRIAGELRAAIASGQYKPGDRLPSKSELQASYGVAVNTVERAIEVLRHEGLVESAQGAGVYVLKIPEADGVPDWAAALVRRVDDLECLMADTRAATGLEQSLPETIAEAQ